MALRLTVLDPQMPNTILQNAMTTIVRGPKSIGDVPMNEDFPGGARSEDERFGDSAIRTYTPRSNSVNQSPGG